MPTNQLQPATRYVAGTAPLTSILGALHARATTRGGDGSPRPSRATWPCSRPPPTAGNVVTVNMNSAFGEITGTDTELAVGQIVATVAAANGNGTGVLFEIDGQRTRCPWPTARRWPVRST